MSDYRLALQAALAAAREAGHLLREEMSRPGGPRPIRERVEELIRTRLLAAANWNYRSEDSGFLDRGGGPHLWLVDPNDGSNHYRRGTRGTSVAIAALRDGVPVLGVVYAFAFPDHHGDLLAWADGCGPLTRNGAPVMAPLLDVDLDDPSTTFDPRLIVYVSPAAEQYAEATSLRLAPARYITNPSVAYRLALTAAGDGVAGMSLNAPTSWDYAAGHALLRGAGGVFVNQDGAPIRYSADGRSACTFCFGGGEKTVRSLSRRDWTGPAPAPEPDPTPLVRPSRYERANLRPGQCVTDAALLSRAQGCLVGQVAGDALGGLVEFMGPDAIRARYPGGVRDLADGGSWHNLAGQPTDDSELALLLARTLAARRRYEPEVVLGAYVDWWNDPRTFDRGNTIRQALSAAARGRTPAERLELARQGASPSSQSNGSLMRISPLGIFGWRQSALAAERARDDSSLTHPNAVCCDSCAVYVAAIAHAVAHGGTPGEAYAAALAEAERSGACAAVRQALEAARVAPPADYVSQQGWVLIALQNAFYQLLHAPSLEEGVVATVMAGGDTDTTGAIAGALLGAVFGRDGVPARWAQVVRCCRPLPGTPTAHPRAAEYWPVDCLELAELLLLAGAEA